MMLRCMVTVVLHGWLCIWAHMGDCCMCGSSGGVLGCVGGCGRGCMFVCMELSVVLARRISTWSRVQNPS